MHVRRLLPALALFLAPGLAGANELVLGVESSAEYDDNIFNIRDGSAVDEEGEMVYRIAPIAELRKRRGDFTYRLRYKPELQLHARFAGQNDWSHDAKGELTYRLSATTELYGDARFRRVPTLDKQIENDEATDDAELLLGRERRKRYQGKLGIRHNFSERLSAEAFGSYHRDRYSEDRLTGNDIYSGQAQLNWKASPKTTYGVGGSYTLQEFEDRTNQNGNETDIWQGFGWVSHVFDPTMSISLQAGPAFSKVDSQTVTAGAVDTIRTNFTFPATALVPVGNGQGETVNVSTCPTLANGSPYFSDQCQSTGLALDRNAITFLVLPAGSVLSESDDSNNTVFGRLTFIKAWQTVDTEFLLERREGTSSGTGQTTTVDTARFTANWKPAELWKVRFVADWTRRETPFERLQIVPVLAAANATVQGVAAAQLTGALGTVVLDDAIETNTFRVTGRVQRNFSRRMALFTSATFRKTDSDGDLISDRGELEKYRAIVGVKYTLDPIQL